MFLRVLAVSALTLSAPAFAQTQIIHAGRVITEASKAPMEKATIMVSDGRIVSIISGHLPAPEGATLIDLADKTVLPGLIDMHVHLSSDPGGDYWRDAIEPAEWGIIVGTKNAALTARAGFTTVRDLGADYPVSYVLRRGTVEGLIAGPRIIAAGKAISIIGGHADINGFRPDVTETLDQGNSCTGPLECAAKVRSASKFGADVIKITATGGVLSQQGRGLDQHFTDAEMKAIADTAHSLGLSVAAHAHGARGIEAAARAGIDTIEHGTFADAVAIKAMKANGTAYIPTLMAFAGIRDRLGKNIYTPTVEAKVRATLEHVGKALNAAYRAGVTIAFGTDAGVYEHGRNGEEFGAMVELGGMTPSDALASATTIAAAELGMEKEIGKIAPGYSADIIAVTGDPLRNIRVLEKIDFVMIRGRTLQ